MKFETNFTGSSKYGISVLHSNILTFKLVLNSIERKERQKIQTKVSMKFRRETNPSTYHRQVPSSVLFFRWQGITPARTCCSAANAVEFKSCDELLTVSRTSLMTALRTDGQTDRRTHVDPALQTDFL